MNLSLQPTASSVILTVLVMAAGIWMSYIACKRNRRPLTFKLEILRLAILGFICFLLFQPEWLITSSPQEKPKVSILEDRSGSMETQDVEISPSMSSHARPTCRNCSRAPVRNPSKTRM